MISAQRFAGKVILVTGGTSGIGLEMTRRFWQEGGHLVVCSLDKNIPEILGEMKDRVEGMECDVTDPKQRAKVIKHVEDKYGRLDVLVLNAGICIHRKPS